MRFFEIILFILLTTRILVPFRQHIRWKDVLSLLILGVLQIQLFVEGYRWQLIPLYGLAFGVALFSLKGRTPKNSAQTKTKQRAVLNFIGGAIILVVALFPPILLPVPSTPPPTGPYQVGTVTVMLVDEARDELYSNQRGEPRRVMVQFWYPAESVAGQKPASWMDNMEVMGPAIANYLGFPDFFLDHIEYSRAHAYKAAPFLPAEGPYPLVLFSHGWNGFRAQNTFQVEELASHGYIVAAPDHTYGAVATIFPDGTATLNNPMVLPSNMGLPEAEFMAAAQLLGAQWAGDLSFIVDYLASNKGQKDTSLLVGEVDFGRIGVMGHSTGGGAAIQFCATDGRCRAVLGMDPYLDPVGVDVLENGLQRPLLGLFSAIWENRRGDNAAQFAQLQGNSVGNVNKIWISDTAHFDFSDLPAFSPLAATLGLKGSINGDRALRIINDYTLAFFDTHLRGYFNPILAGPLEYYPEVNWANP
jgi:dienelactone hydrolase